MERKTSLLVGAAAAAIAAGPALAAEPAVPPATSYAELLQPIPNAVERLKAADAQADSQARPAGLIDVQYHHHHNNYNNGYNNHHHHHHHNRWWYRHNGYLWFGNAWVTRDYYNSHHHHHHHHHHHNNY
jgi:hypothetical protein